MEFKSTKNNRSEVIHRFFNRRGFTMVEVLLSMVVIGVVAAVLIPIISQLIPNQNKAMFKTGYSELNTAITNMINDEDNYPSTAMANNSDAIRVPRGFNNTAATINGTVNKFCYFLSQELNAVPSSVYCPPATGSAMAGWSAGQAGTFRTSDGISWTLYFRDSDAQQNTQFPMAPLTNTNLANANSDFYPVMIFMDVNGTGGPNCLESDWRSVWGAMTAPFPAICPTTATPCSNDPDTFVVDVRYDGKMHVGGYHGYKFTDLCANSILNDSTNIK